MAAYALALWGLGVQNSSDRRSHREVPAWVLSRVLLVSCVKSALFCALRVVGVGSCKW